MHMHEIKINYFQLKNFNMFNGDLNCLQMLTVTGGLEKNTNSFIVKIIYQISIVLFRLNGAL